VLVTASCTTGWADWIHGELWVCPDGLLRRPLGLGQTIAHLAGPTVDTTQRPTRPAMELQSDSGGRSRWISWASIEHATLKSGPMTDSLHLNLQGGQRAKFLWFAHDGAKQYFEKTLPTVIGSRLES
jgi:hypothetical protein